MTQFKENARTDERTDRRMDKRADRKTLSYRTLPATARGPKNALLIVLGKKTYF